jgi:uncharacterized protein (DUF1499 family)
MEKNLVEQNFGPIKKKYSIYLLLSTAVTALAVLAGLAAVLAGPGSRIGLWNFRTGFEILHWALYGSIVAVVSAIAVLIFIRKEKLKCLLMVLPGAVIGLVVIVVLVNIWLAARNAPPIHDISTDIVNPPQFVDILPLRKGATNTAEYGGPEVAIKQLQAYPDIKPLVLAVPSDQAFDKALTTARNIGWKIVYAGKADGRIEATATTFWFGFTDDIVIRVTPVDHRSIIDVRSVSRVGRGDAGANARRIRTFLKRLQQST